MRNFESFRRSGYKPVGLIMPLTVLFLLIKPITVKAEQQKIDSLYQVLKQTTDDKSLVDIYNDIAWAYIFSHFDSTSFYAQKALALAQEIDYIDGGIYASRIEASMMYLYGQPRKAIELSEPILVKAIANSKDYEVGKLYNLLGNSYSHLNQPDSTLYFYNKALDVFEAINDEKEILGVKYNIANAIRFYDNTKALEIYFDVLQMERELNNAYGVARVQNMIGSIYESMDKEVEAIEFYKKGIDVYHQMGYLRDVAGAYLNISSSFSSINEIDSALHYAFLALDINLNIKNYPWAIRNYLSICQSYTSVEDLDNALKYAKKAENMAEAFNVESEYGNISGFLSNYYLKSGDYVKAKKYVEKAIEVSAKSKNYKNLTVSYRRLRSIHLRNKDYKKALEALGNAYVYNDSAMNSGKFRELGNLESKYKYEQIISEKEKEQRLLDIETQNQLEKEKLYRNIFIAGLIVLVIIVLLLIRGYLIKKKSNQLQLEKNRIIEQQKAEVERQNLQIEKSLSEKELLLKEIHHRVKNNLQIISSLLDMQSSSIEDKDALSVVSDGQHRVKAMALIHQKLYQNEDIAVINFQEYLEQIINQLSLLYQGDAKVGVEVDAKGFEFDIDTAVPLGLIVNELVSNTFKHAYKNISQPKIFAKIELKGASDYILTIKDNGIGMPEGFDIEQSQSLGLRLVNGLSTQLLGTVEYEYLEGAIFRIIFKDTITRKTIA